MNIHVGNLSPETSVAALRSCFEVYGAVSDVTISTYLVEGVIKAVAIVSMPSTDHGRAAIAGMAQMALGGNQLSVHEE
jgi:hypothetical protein